MAIGNIVVIGGGIAGISCIEALFQDYTASNPPYERITLISEGRLVKKVTNYESSGRHLERFMVSEFEANDLLSRCPAGLHCDQLIGRVERINVKDKVLLYSNNEGAVSRLSFDMLCICSGSKPRLLKYSSESSNRSEIEKRIVIIRDTNTVSELRAKLTKCRRLLIVGNGGISLELVANISDCEKIWLIRDESIGSTFFDSGAAKFLLDATKNGSKIPETRESFRANFSESKGQLIGEFGPSLGPNWSHDIALVGRSLSGNKLQIIHQDEIAQINYKENQEYPLLVSSKNGRQIDCDLIATAIGVIPNSLEVTGGHIERSQIDGGILIDIKMQTSASHIYAAGDVVSCDKWPSDNLWFQMRLWTQARQMGFYAAKCMISHIRGHDPSIYFNFDCFTHCTSFFGYNLTLLGLYNGQTKKLDLHENFEVIARVEPGKDYVKVLVKDDGRIIGAVLLGDSGLDETIENLIHDRIDVSAFKGQLLDNTVDIEDYFD